MRVVFFLIILISLNLQIANADHASPSIDSGGGGTIFTTSGATLPKGKFAFGSSLQFIEQDDLSTEALEAGGAAIATGGDDVHSTDSLLSVSLNAAYGITDNLTVGFSLPYVRRNDVFEGEEDGGVGEAEFAGDSEGLGDASVFFQYRFYSDSVQDASFISGVKTPTGDTDELELEGSLFEVEQQPGTGSWDPFLGFSYSRSFGNFGFASNLLYTFSTEGDQQTTPGDIFNYNFAGSYRFIFGVEDEGHDHGSHEHHPLSGIVEYIDLVLELNGDRRERFNIDGDIDSNTGGNTIYLGPGIRVGFARGISLYTAFQGPVINDLNGIQSEPDYRVLGGLSLTF